MNRAGLRQAGHTVLQRVEGSGCGGEACVRGHAIQLRAGERARNATSAPPNSLPLVQFNPPPLPLPPTPRYVLLVRFTIELTEVALGTLEAQRFRNLSPKERLPYEDIVTEDREHYNDMARKIPYFWSGCVMGRGLQKEERSKKDVWRPPVFYFLRDRYEDENEQKEASRATVVSGLYDQWLAMSEEMKRPYEEESSRVTDTKKAHRNDFAFSCYCALWKRYERMKRPGESWRES